MSDGIYVEPFSMGAHRTCVTCIYFKPDPFNSFRMECAFSHRVNVVTGEAVHEICEVERGKLMTGCGPAGANWVEEPCTVHSCHADCQPPACVARRYAEAKK